MIFFPFFPSNPPAVVISLQAVEKRFDFDLGFKAETGIDGICVFAVQSVVSARSNTYRKGFKGLSGYFFLGSTWKEKGSGSVTRPTHDFLCTSKRHRERRDGCAQERVTIRALRGAQPDPGVNRVFRP